MSGLRTTYGAVLGSLVLSALVGCSSGSTSSAPASKAVGSAAAQRIVVHQFGLAFTAPDGVGDTVFAMGTGEEGKPAAFLSSRSLVAAGGASCSAGALGAVSPYPLGRLLLADETPEKVAAEAVDNPDDSFGEFVAQVADRYLYYSEPPAEACGPGKGVAALQAQQAALLKTAVRSAVAVPVS